MSIFVLGSTGLVGNQTLKTLVTLPSFPHISTIGRRAPKVTSEKIHSIVTSESSTWATAFRSLTPIPSIVISALGCTRAEAGSLEKQWEVDHGINIAIATAAKKAGCKAFILVSSGGCRSWIGSRLPYGRLKIAIEDDIKKLGFEYYVIVRPGMILGEREHPHTGQGIMTAGIKTLGSMAPDVADALGQDADVIGRAVVAAAKLIKEGKASKSPWILEQADIVRLGRTEWTGE